MLVPLFAYIYRKTGYYSYYLRFSREFYVFSKTYDIWQEYKMDNPMDLTFAQYIDVHKSMWDFRNKVYRKFEL